MIKPYFISILCMKLHNFYYYIAIKIFNRIILIIDQIIPINYAVLRSNRSCTDHIVALTL